MRTSVVKRWDALNQVQMSPKKLLLDIAQFNCRTDEMGMWVFFGPLGASYGTWIAAIYSPLTAIDWNGQNISMWAKGVQ